MPELPEVETIKNQLLFKIKNKIISRIKVIDYHKNVQGNIKQILAQITDVKRRAKFLIFFLSNGYSFLIHLKMTGQLIYLPKFPDKLKKETHLVFSFSDGSTMLFNDFRKFGIVKIGKTEDLAEFLKKFGPEPLEIKFVQFKSLLLAKSKSKLKPTLLDQKVISGIGNIYAQEACFLSGIQPTRRISTLTDLELKKLYNSIQQVLKAAIKHQGTSFDTIYVTPDGQKGNFDTYLKVYHR